MYQNESLASTWLRTHGCSGRAVTHLDLPSRREALATTRSKGCDDRANQRTTQPMADSATNLRKRQNMRCGTATAGVTGAR
eukprot:6086024-Pyramimonas_sp.AAC.1